MQAGEFRIPVAMSEQEIRARLEFLCSCFEEAFSAVGALELQPVSTAELRPAERVELLVTAGSIAEEVYGNRLVFTRVSKEPDRSLTWLMAVRSFSPQSSPLSALAGMPVLKPGVSVQSLFDPEMVPSLVDPAELKEFLHSDNNTKKTLWHIVTFGRYDSFVFCGGALFSSGEDMLQGFGCVDLYGQPQRQIVPGRDVAFPDEVLIGAEFIPRRWPKPVSTFIEGVFGEDRSNEMPIGMRRVSVA
jgi:hypothetical protein